MNTDATEILRRYAEAKSTRNPYERDWREAARHCLPEEYGRWTDTTGSGPVGNVASSSMSSARRTIYDTTAKRALPKFAAILERILTPQGHTYHQLGASDPTLMKKTKVVRYFDDLNRLLFLRRYEPAANFQPVQSGVYTSFGVYGNSCKYIAGRKDKRGLLYTSVPFQSVFWLQNDEGVVDTCFRRLQLTARQAERKFGRDKLPEKIKLECEKAAPSDTKTFEIAHVVAPADDYNGEALDGRRYRFLSIYTSVEDKENIGERDGYRSFPFVCPRHFTVDNGPYAFSIAQQAQGSMATLNQMKKTMLRQGQKAVDPVILTYDDGAISGRVDLRPGAVNAGGISADGRMLMQTLPTGNLAIGEKLLENERDDINDAFFVQLFELLIEKDMSATEVMARLTDKATLLAPTMGLMQCSDLGPTIEREMEVLSDLGQLPDMPFELKEADGEYTTTYTSPLARMMAGEATQGYFQMLQVFMEYAAQTGDKKPLMRFNFDRAMPEIGYGLAVPSMWFNSDEELQAMQDKADQQQQVDNAGKVAPAVAGAAKAVAGMPPEMAQQMMGAQGGGGGLPALPPPQQGAPM